MKDNKKASLLRRKGLAAKKQVRVDKKQTSRKVHDTKGKNTHGRSYR